jgi:hypothetical protein
MITYKNLHGSPVRNDEFRDPPKWDVSGGVAGCARNMSKFQLASRFGPAVRAAVRGVNYEFQGDG